MVGIVSNNSGNSILQQVQERQNNLLERLASGRQINSASDGAAAQQIIDRLTSEIGGNQQALNNVYDGISLAQVGDAALSGVTNDVNRIRELSIQAGNGLLTDADRSALQQEVTQLQDNIRSTLENTDFNGNQLFTADSTINFQSGSQAGQTIGVNTRDLGSALSGILSADISTQSGAQAALDSADDAVETVGSNRAEFGAIQNRFESTARQLTESTVNEAAARSRIQDTDFAQAASDLAANNILSQANIAVQAQSNQQQSQVLSLLG
ncbi:flagellin N-terminal helical domain-containing protein [Planctobacterium marinum]|uniref:flagellin N-terminal helical domain-containing protein n=1 Tax=Planctobacterium marinum TaxID=1631968 RepID=UPI001E29997E|nr:flagellin [Planctobacterium marinum]MCC2606212.1 flagellin [Planctobacterium marinum]